MGQDQDPPDQQPGVGLHYIFTETKSIFHYIIIHYIKYTIHHYLFELRSVFLRLFATNTLCAFRFEEVSRSTSVQNSCTLSQAGSSFSDRPLQWIVPFSKIHPLLFFLSKKVGR